MKVIAQAKIKTTLIARLLQQKDINWKNGKMYVYIIIYSYWVEIHPRGVTKNEQKRLQHFFRLQNAQQMKRGF